MEEHECGRDLGIGCVYCDTMEAMDMLRGVWVPPMPRPGDTVTFKIYQDKQNYDNGKVIQGEVVKDEPIRLEITAGEDNNGTEG